MGRVDVLLRFLQRIGQDRPEQLTRYLPAPGDVKGSSIAEQLAAGIVQKHPEWLSDYAEAQQEAGERDNRDFIPAEQGIDERGYWVLPAGNTATVSARESLQLWLHRGLWAMRKSTAGRRHLKPGDQICFYAAKVGVVAAAEVAGLADQLVTASESPEPNNTEPLYKVPLARVRWLSQPVVLDEPLRAQLDAFKGRSTVGVWAWFIQTPSRVNEHDFRLLVSSTEGDVR